MNLRQVPITEIRPYWRNPRNNEKAVQAVKQSILDYGYNVPIVVDNEGIIIAGHTRYKALLQLGREIVDVVVADLTPNKAKQYRIADNKTSEHASWDMNLLISELREIDASQSMQVYFNDINLDKLLHETATISSVTAQDVINSTTAQNEHFGNWDKANQQSYIPIECPHCNHEFHIDKYEVIRTPGVALPDDE